MKMKFIYFILLIHFITKGYGQQFACADSSYRIKFTFDGTGATLTNNPDTVGRNYFTGQYVQGNGLAVMKTTWGDSIVWAKKIFSGSTYLDCYNSIPAPDGTFILTGNYGGAQSNRPELLMCRMDTNGVVLWMKRFRYNQNHLFGNYAANKPLLITNNAIFFTASVYTTGTILFDQRIDITVKLDLNGNILWSTGFSMNFLPSGYQTNTGINGAPTLYNGKVIVCGDSGWAVNNSSGLLTIMKLNDANGSLAESFGYKTLPDPIIKGIYPQYIKYNNDNTFSLTGYSIYDYFGTLIISNSTFNTLLDVNFNPVKNYYFSNNILDATFDFDFNNLGQQALLATDGRLGKSKEKYFFTLNKDNTILRSRKFIIPNYILSPSLFNYYDTKIDDKQNIHFTIQAIENNKAITDYTRISNLAPNSTLGCFGKDTSILTRHPFTLIKQPFAWDNIQSNMLETNDVPYTIQDAIVTKELVCKIVSRCDSVHINGPAAACVGVPVRYTVSKNTSCFKNLDWGIDTTVATIINIEGDSAITLSFKKKFTGYIRASLTDCVVKDSFLVKAVVPKMPALINRTDSILCPGKTLVLNANAGYNNYIWHGNTVNQQLTVSSAGVYTITAADSCGITKTDSIKVILSDTSFILSATQTICLNDTAFIVLPGDINNIIWQPTTNSLLRNKTLVAYPAQTTVYSIYAERLPNCTLSKTSEVVIKICPATVFIPNSFTPNNDNKNDIFKPAISQPLPFYHLQIFNRYGQPVFETSNQQAGWDGMYKGSKQPMGGYIYQCSYRFAGGVQKMVKGYFILIR